MIKSMPIFNTFDKQRYLQFSPQDAANWYAVAAPSGKQKQALYPTMGRKHVNIDEQNILIYDQQPRKIFKSIDYVYIVVGRQVWQLNKNWESFQIAIPSFTKSAGDLNFAYLPVPSLSATTQAVFSMFVDGTHIFVVDESTFPGVMTLVTDGNAPVNPLYVAAFGNRFTVSSANSTQFQLSQINMGGVYNPATLFTIPGATPVVFAQESGIIRQMAALQNQLFIFCDYSTGIWSNTPSIFDNGTTKTSFPWRKNTSFQLNYGIADPDSLDVDFGMLTWLAQNRNGLVTFMSSTGQNPESISTQAVNVLLQDIANKSSSQGVLNLDTEGFLYQYEDTIFYRVSIGPYIPYGSLDIASLSVCLEYNFNTQTWHRSIELNGQRNRIESHVFFNNKHLVNLRDDPAIYDMSGSYYVNETINVLQPDHQATDAFLTLPFRYENVTPIISEPDYSEFITDYIQIDFVYGDLDTIPNPNPDLYKPQIELWISDDSGISFYSADDLQFSPLGVYLWRMRWYQGGPSRNRVYKLIAVSSSPIVILGAVMDVRRASGGAN